MLEYLIVNGDGNVIGKSSIAGQNHIKTTIKPFQKNVTWNGKELDYHFVKPIKTPIKRRFVYEAICRFYGLLTSNIYWLNGKETRKHNGQISVLIPCYKQSRYVITAVKSCLKQTQKPTEIIVLLMDKDSYALEPQLKEMGVICYKEPQMNVCKARTYLAEKCKTDWLIFLDADDFLTHDFIEKVDKVDGAVVKVNSVIISTDRIILEADENPTSYNRAEASVHQNLTGLMHKEVFFDFGLNEKYKDGGEDFDFLIRLWASKKWKISYCKDVYFIYREHFDESSLSHTDDCARSLFQSLIDNRDFLIEEILNAPDMAKRLKLKWLLENPSQENIEKFAISLSLEHRLYYSAFDFLEDYIKNEVSYLTQVSMQRHTENVFNKKDYYFINCNDKDLHDLENTCFDVVFYNLNVLDVNSILKKEKSMIVKKDIWDSIKDKYSPLDMVIYLLKNYSCFISASEKQDIKISVLTEDFVNSLSEIRFDDTVQNACKLVRDYYCEGMFTTVRKTQYPVTFVLDKRCNCDCSYCCQKGSHTKKISDEKMFENFDKALSHYEMLFSKEEDKILTVQIMGGEPTMWSEWLQKKVLDRLDKYRYFVLFSNGYNKESPIYKSEKAIKKLHIVEWEKELTKKEDSHYMYNEFPLFIIQEKDRQKYKEIVTKYEGSSIGVSVCKSKDTTENVSFDFMKELITLDQYNIDVSTIKEFVRNVEQLGIDTVRHNCRIKPIVSNVDCETMRVFPCCNSKTSYPLEEYTLDKKADYDADCRFCNYIY